MQLIDRFLLLLNFTVAAKARKKFHGREEKIALQGRSNYTSVGLAIE